MNDRDGDCFVNGLTLESHSKIHDDINARQEWENLAWHRRAANGAPKLWPLRDHDLHKWQNACRKVLWKHIYFYRRRSKIFWTCAVAEKRDSDHGCSH